MNQLQKMVFASINARALASTEQLHTTLMVSRSSAAVAEFKEALAALILAGAVVDHTVTYLHSTGGSANSKVSEVATHFYSISAEHMEGSPYAGEFLAVVQMGRA